MALYTQNSTGFLCEFATNPGLGYTAVAAQPTDTLANRVSWWRDRDKGSLTSTWHPSEQQTGEDPGSNVLYMAFSQESGIVSSDASGVVTDGYLGAVTQIRIMRGVNNVTQSEGWTLGFTAVDATYTTTGTDVVTLQFTSIPTDKTGGYVNVIATRTGSATLSKTFRVLKVIRGLDGSSGVVIDLSNEAHVVPTDGNGENGNFTDCNTTASIFVGSTDTSASWTWTATPSAGLSGTASNSNRTYTVSALSVDTGTVTFVATRSGFPNQTAIFTVSKAKGGVTYQIEPSVGAINKSAAGVYTPSAITFSSYRTTTTTREAFSTYFYIERQSSLGGAWTLVYQSSSAQTSYSYTVPAGTFGVRGSIYLTIGQYLDVEAVPVVFDGQNGADGIRGSRQIVVDGTSWSDAAAWNGIVTQTGTTPVLSDLVTIANAGAGFSASKFYTGGAYDGDWVTPNAYINGNLLVTGTVGADRIAAGTIGAYTITLGGASSIIQSTNYVAGTSGWRIKGDGVGEFQNVTVRGSLNASDLTAGTLNISRIADTSITSAKISSLSADKLTAGTIDANTITVSNLHADQLTVGTINGVQITGGAISGTIQNVESGTARYFGDTLTKLFTTLTLPTGSVSRQAVLINANITLYNTLGLNGFYINSLGAYTLDPSGSPGKYPVLCSIYIFKNGSPLTVRFIDIPFLLRESIAHIQYVDTSGGTNADYYEIWASCTSYETPSYNWDVGWFGCFNIIELKR